MNICKRHSIFQSYNSRDFQILSLWMKHVVDVVTKWINISTDDNSDSRDYRGWLLYPSPWATITPPRKVVIPQPYLQGTLIPFLLTEVIVNFLEFLSWGFLTYKGWRNGTNGIQVLHTFLDNVFKFLLFWNKKC